MHTHPRVMASGAERDPAHVRAAGRVQRRPCFVTVGTGVGTDRDRPEAEGRRCGRTNSADGSRIALFTPRAKGSGLRVSCVRRPSNPWPRSSRDVGPDCGETGTRTEPAPVAHGGPRRRDGDFGAPDHNSSERRTARDDGTARGGRPDSRDPGEDRASAPPAEVPPAAAGRGRATDCRAQTTGRRPCAGAPAA
jgi:hypothetical protein